MLLQMQKNFQTVGLLIGGLAEVSQLHGLLRHLTFR
jgi:hypothetical protein